MKPISRGGYNWATEREHGTLLLLDQCSLLGDVDAVQELPDVLVLDKAHLGDWRLLGEEGIGFHVYESGACAMLASQLLASGSSSR